MKYFFTLATVLFSSLIYSQSPQGVNYQAMVRNTAGQVIVNQSVGVKSNILQGSPTGAATYSETFNITTSAFGLINIVIGQGNALSGSFDQIDWASGPYYIEILVDHTGGTNYSPLGTQQIVSVPYALHSNTAEYALYDDDSDSTNELQTLSYANDTLYLSDGNEVFIEQTSGVNSANVGRKSIGKVGSEAWSVPGWSIEYTTGGYIYPGRIYYTPIFVSDTTTYTGLGIQMGSQFTNVFDLKVGMYSWSNGLPDTLMYELGTFETNIPSGHIISNSFTLNPGYYFLTYVASSGSAIYPNSATRYSPPVSGKSSTINGETDCVTLSIGDANTATSITSNGFPNIAVTPNTYSCICAIYFRE